MGDNCVVALSAALSHLTVLQNLHVRWNGIGAEGAVALSSSLSHLTALQMLDVSHNMCADDSKALKT
jgi:hypothetical protein